MFGQRLAQVKFAVDGQVAIMEDHFLVGSVRSPLLSMGRLLQRGWKINPCEKADSGLSLVAPDGGIEVPITYKKNSLAIRASICKIEMQEDWNLMVRAVVKVPDKVFEEIGRKGWHRGVAGMGKPFHVSIGIGKFVDPGLHVERSYWPRRSTLVQMNPDENRWQVIELCADYAQYEDRCGEIEDYSLDSTVLTILHGSDETLSSLGEVLDGSDRGLEETNPSTSSGEFQFRGEPELPEELSAPTLPEEVEQSDQGGGLVEDDTWEFVERDLLRIGDYEVRADSPHRILQQAAEYLGVSKAGSKAALWTRLNEKMIKLERDLAFETANRLYREQHEKVRIPTIPRAPSAEGVLEHEHAHIPYRNWCPYCVMCKSNADHQRNPADESEVRRAIPSIQMDFCYGKKEDRDKLATVLVVLDTWTKMLLAIPLESKGKAIRQCAEQICRFSLTLGYYNDVEFVADSEPTMKALLENIRAVRNGLGYPSTLTSGKPYERGRTAQVERWIQTLRKQARTLLNMMQEKCKVELPTGHALVNWCFIHGAWLLNRYHRPSHGQATPFELAFSRPYGGKVAFFGEYIHLLLQKA